MSDPSSMSIEMQTTRSLKADSASVEFEPSSVIVSTSSTTWRRVAEGFEFMKLRKKGGLFRPPRLLMHGCGLNQIEDLCSLDWQEVRESCGQQ
jgi:hypothetical protein